MPNGGFDPSGTTLQALQLLSMMQRLGAQQSQGIPEVMQLMDYLEGQPESVRGPILEKFSSGRGVNLEQLKGYTPKVRGIREQEALAELDALEDRLLRLDARTNKRIEEDILTLKPDEGIRLLMTQKRDQLQATQENLERWAATHQRAMSPQVQRHLESIQRRYSLAPPTLDEATRAIERLHGKSPTPAVPRAPSQPRVPSFPLPPPASAPVAPRREFSLGPEALGGAGPGLDMSALFEALQQGQAEGWDPTLSGALGRGFLSQRMLGR